MSGAGSVEDLCVVVNLPGRPALTGTEQSRTAASSSSDARRWRTFRGLKSSSSILGVFSGTDNRRWRLLSFPHHFHLLLIFCFVFLFFTWELQRRAHTEISRTGRTEARSVHTLRTVIRGGAKDSRAPGGGRRKEGVCSCSCVCLTCCLTPFPRKTTLIRRVTYQTFTVFSPF